MSDYDVDPIERLRELWTGGSVGDDETFTYSWTHGSERLDFDNAHGGGLHYRGEYHPDVVCEGNPCRFCGRVVA